MKTCSFLVTFSLAIVLVNAFSTEEHVKRFFRPEHRPLLPAITSLQLREDESYRAPAPLNDDSTKCLAHCEPECKKLQVPDFLTKNESFHKFEAMPINCVLASTVVFNKTPLYRCHFLQLYLFDCCRNCNAVYAKCMLRVGLLNGGPEFCYRESYKCMCHCLDKHTPPEIPPFP
ncbi:uncharacterized protein LOC110049119 [Orbicella faveolata]|uniref:uncharacterized protein LOC110049119 n=1 Tax=Orbicella faveolata TaxID=48498 RepID=UPI0009E3410B|nr:uncharacterized protein LOC110049119 [Orbicella faveolata]